jgi:hypothetical protein
VAIKPSFTSLATNVSALSKLGYSNAEPFSQNDRLDASGRVTSFRSRSMPVGSKGMKVPSVKLTPIQWPSAGQSAEVALVSGPRTVRNVLPASRVTTITQLLAAIERKVPARSL